MFEDVEIKNKIIDAVYEILDKKPHLIKKNSDNLVSISTTNSMYEFLIQRHQYKDSDLYFYSLQLSLYQGNSLYSTKIADLDEKRAYKFFQTNDVYKKDIEILKQAQQKLSELL